MCERISFLYRTNYSGSVSLAVYDLESHGNTQAFFPELTEKEEWYEGHYTPNKIECRTPAGRDRLAEKFLADNWPSYAAFDAYVCAELLGHSGAGTASGSGV